MTKILDQLRTWYTVRDLVRDHQIGEAETVGQAMYLAWRLTKSWQREPKLAIWQCEEISSGGAVQSSPVLYVHFENNTHTAIYEEA